MSNKTTTQLPLISTPSPVRVSIHGLKIHNTTVKEARDSILNMLSEPRMHAVFTPNAEIVMQAVRNPELANMLNQADLLLADGAGVVLGSKLLKTPLREKVSGIDLAKALMSLNQNPKLSFYLFGGSPGVAEKAAVHLLSNYPGIRIAGYRHGYFQPEETPGIVADINSKKPDILYVCLGAPKQEQWITENSSALNCRAAIGLGGSLDVFAGVGKLAPEWMRKAGLEWLFRLIREPHRWRRMLDLPRFILLTLRVRLGLINTKK